MANKLSDMIDRLVEQRLSELLAEATGEVAAERAAAGGNDDDTASGIERENAARENASPRAPRSRRFALKVQYAMVPIRANASAASKDARKRTVQALTPALREVWDYVKAHTPTTVRDMEKALDRGNKSIQSSIHQLRTLGLVESQPLSKAAE